MSSIALPEDLANEIERNRKAALEQNKPLNVRYAAGPNAHPVVVTAVKEDCVEVTVVGGMSLLEDTAVKIAAALVRSGNTSRVTMPITAVELAKALWDRLLAERPALHGGSATDGAGRDAT